MDFTGRQRKALNIEMAGGLGFEPRLAESESAVLPLDDPPKGGKLKAERLPFQLTDDLHRSKGAK
jgi:hypothetical protein